MKSPTSSVGTIELDGILNGSTRNERSRNTIRITGKKLTEYSTHHGCLASAGRERRSEEHTSELQSLTNLVCRLLLEKKKKKNNKKITNIKTNKETNTRTNKQQYT